MSAIDSLNFGRKTSLRVTWESWSFKIVGPYQVQVTNEAYGSESDQHRYVVTVEHREGVLFPVSCECKDDLYNDQYECKHRVAVASVGGEVVLEASAAFSSRPTTAEGLSTDGGTIEGDTEGCSNGDPDCNGPNSNVLPCFACYLAGDGHQG